MDWVYKVDVSKHGLIVLAQKQSSELLCIYFRLPRLISTNRKAVALRMLFRMQLIVWLTFYYGTGCPKCRLTEILKYLNDYFHVPQVILLAVIGTAVATFALFLWVVVTLVYVFMYSLVSSDYSNANKILPNSGEFSLLQTCDRRNIRILKG